MKGSSLRRSIVSFAAVLALLAPVAVCTVTTPEIHAKVVDAETGKPQEWLKVIVYAGKIVRTIGGEVVPTLFTKTFYFHTENGEIAIPSQHFRVLDFVRYKDWELFIKSPGHDLLRLSGRDVTRLMGAVNLSRKSKNQIVMRNENNHSSLSIKLKRYTSGFSWEGGYEDDEVSLYEIPKRIENHIELNARDTAIHEVMMIEEFRDLILRWPEYSRFPSARMKYQGRLECAEKYIDMISDLLCSNKKVALGGLNMLWHEASIVVERLQDAEPDSKKIENLKTKLLLLQNGECK